MGLQVAINKLSERIKRKNHSYRLLIDISEKDFILPKLT